MTEQNVPPRWLDDTADMPDAELRRGLSVYMELGPSPEQQARMQAQLSHALETAGALQLARASSMKLFAKSLVMLTLAVAVGVTWWNLSGRKAESPGQAPRVEAATAPLPGLTPTPTPTPVDTAAHDEIVKQVVATQPTVRAAPARKLARVAKPEAMIESVQDPQAELALLSRARRLLASSPTRALALTDEHATTYAHGMFEQEREVLAIEALVHAGRRSEAEARAKAFQRRHPSSAHLERIQVVLKTP